MPSTVFKHAIPASFGPQTHALDNIANVLLPYALFPWICPLCLKHKFTVTPSEVYCTLEHFTFSHLSAICQIYVQQYTAFETLSHVIMLKQGYENQKFTQGTTTFPNLDKTVYQVNWM
jgi:hypothetical protein